MLKKTLLLLLVVAGFAAVASLPAASAHRIPLRVHPSAQCPPGTQNQNYCIRYCVVPRLEHNSLLTAFVKAALGGCRIGTIHIIDSRNAPALTRSNRGLFTVIAQQPPPGTFHRFLYPITVWAKYNGHGHA